MRVNIPKKAQLLRVIYFGDEIPSTWRDVWWELKLDLGDPAIGLFAGLSLEGRRAAEEFET